MVVPPPLRWCEVAAVYEVVMLVYLCWPPAAALAREFKFELLSGETSRTW